MARGRTNHNCNCEDQTYDMTQEFIKEQMHLLHDEIGIYIKKSKKPVIISAEVIDAKKDENLGIMTTFYSTQTNMLKPRDGLHTTDGRVKKGIVYEKKETTFVFISTETDEFSLGKLYNLKKTFITNHNLLRFILSIKDNNLYPVGEPQTKLRNLLLGLICLTPPSKTTPIHDFFNRKMNDNQKEAVQSALSTQALTIIHGPPGTGKSSTLVEIILQESVRGGKVLVCAASNTAVDNLMRMVIKRQSNLEVIRLGHPAKIARDLISSSIACKGHRNSSITNNTEIIMNADAVFGTLSSCTTICSKSTSPLHSVPNNHFSSTIIDESCQILEAQCWSIIPITTKLILVGDYKQLPPTILSTSPKTKRELSISMMERLILHPCINKQVITLDVQYRMKSTIMAWPSQEFYQNKLKISLPNIISAHNDEHITKKTFALKSELILINTKGTMPEKSENINNNHSFWNPGEINIIEILIKRLLEDGITNDQIGIISPYSLQTTTLTSHTTMHTNLEICTLDSFQGREKPIIILTTVRSNNSGKIGFLSETRRLNVAITRARNQFIIVSDRITLANNSTWKSLFQFIDTHGTVLDPRSLIKQVMSKNEIYTPDEY